MRILAMINLTLHAGYNEDWCLSQVNDVFQTVSETILLNYNFLSVHDRW
jgi:hypothetical protein